MGRVTMRSLFTGILIIIFALGVRANISNRAFTITLDAEFSDVVIDIENAILNKGFVIDFNGDIAKMLERTSNGSNDSQAVYKYAKFWQFCSSQFTRQMVEINPENIAYCPFVIFAYETVSDPGQVIVGFQPLVVGKDDDTLGMTNTINAMLISIVSDVQN